MRRRPQGGEECGPSCRERRTLWKEELSSLSTLVGTVATLLAVITLSEGAEPGVVTGWHPRWSGEPGMEGILVMDYWMVLPIIVMVVTGLIMRGIQRHLGEVWKPGLRWSHTSKSRRSQSSHRRGRDKFQIIVKNKQREDHRTGSATPAVQRGSVPRRLFFAAP